MFDFSDVTRFQHRLRSASNITWEDEWKDDWSNKVADRWRQNVRAGPYLTGAYYHSIHVTRDGAAASARHAPFVERGTSRTAPQPTLRPAVHEVAPRAVADAGNRAIRI